MSVQFQWDAQKATRNAKKHRVTFAEATTVFRDPLAFIFDDEEHSEEELRENHRWSFEPKSAPRRIIHRA